MAKSDASLGEIDLSRAFSPPHTAKWASDKPINAFDTETHNGQPFMLSVAWDNGKTRIYPVNGPRLIGKKELFDAITNRNARSSLNVWFNLSFDADVILSTVLDRKQLGRIAITGHVDTDDYSITYIPSKFLEIRDTNGHIYTHYDIAQFYYSSLEIAVNEFLDEAEKLSHTIETALFGSLQPQTLIDTIESDDTDISFSDLPVNRGDTWTDRHAWNYIKANYDLIYEYAKVDAEITRDLWERSVDIGEGLEIPMGKPYSTGYLAESYLNEHLGHKPGLGPKDMRKMAWDAYAGGRFEVIKRGYIGEVAGPDINSAYPWVLSNLPDPKTLTWTNYSNPSFEVIENADYGFINATVTTDKDRPIQPFTVKMDGKRKYPALDSVEITTIKPIFELAYNHGYLLDYKIHDAWLATEGMYADYPFSFIPQKYDERKTFASEGKNKLELWLKIVLNSMYGKTCQTTPKREEIEDNTIVELESYESYVNELQLPPDLREIFDSGIIERLEAGAWFNPFLASYITGMTRYELHKRILEYGLEYDTVMLATDSIMVELDAFDKSNFADDLVPDNDVPFKRQLGMWDYDYKGKAFVIGAGVYEIEKPDGSIKTKTRGFKEADLDGRLLEEIKLVDEYLDIRSNRPITAKEAIWHGQKLSDVSNFTDFERKLSADMDDKRQWYGDASFESFLREKQNSDPLVLSA